MRFPSTSQLWDLAGEEWGMRRRGERGRRGRERERERELSCCGVTTTLTSLKL